MSRPDFLKKWASSRPSIPPISDPDYALGFANYLGAIPPSTDDHDYIMNLQDERAVWLGEQMLLAVGHEWQSDIEYNQYAVVRSTVNGRLYRSALSSNTGNEPSASPASWILQETLTQHGLVKFDTAGVTNWTVPLAMRLGIIKPRVKLWGGGGGGGYTGGGGGGYSEKIVDLTGVTSVTVTIGAAGAFSSTAPTSGGTTSFGAIFSATGGNAGSVSGGATDPSRPAGGNGVGGDFNVFGGPGQSATRGADGGGSFGTPARRGATNTANEAQSGLWPGGGCGGRADVSPHGGAGTLAGAGGCVIEW